MHVTLVSWNVAGTSFLKVPEKKRAKKRQLYNKQLKQLISQTCPDIILLQEVIRFGHNSPEQANLEQDGEQANELFDTPDGYYYQVSISIDTLKNCYPPLWDKIRTAGNWDKNTYLGHGLGILWRKELLHSSLWAISNKQLKSGAKLEKETVRFETGLFSGNRDTEPRMAMVAHFNLSGKDIFVVNFHLTTLKGEREGFPERDQYGSQIRQNQLDTILNGIVSRLNADRQQQIKKHNKKSKPGLWILGGDLNATIQSAETMKLTQRNFARLCSDLPTKRPNKKINENKGSKIKVDYLFAGPLYFACQPDEISQSNKTYQVLYDLDISDHYPIVARFPLKSASKVTQHNE
ncbi:MAG: endonuclease/exonuclease/phosphatase family protein [Pseudomonadota bacterium]